MQGDPGKTPFIMWKDESKNNTGELYEGFMIDMLKQIQQIVKFNYTIIPRNSSSFGKPINEDKTKWDGMIGELVDEVSQKLYP